jgi:hypothetical protein
VGRFDGRRVADLQGLQGGSLAHESAVAIVLENAHMELDGTGAAELAERLGGSLANEITIVIESTYEGLDGTGVADLAERPGGSLARARGPTPESGNEGLDGTGVADLAERPGGIRANVCVPVLEARDLEPDLEFLDDRSEQGHRAAS